jgi:hypothetical protein
VIGRHHPGRRGAPQWSITVCSPDNTRLIFHAAVDDLKELQALATEARSRSQALKIWVRDPFDKVRSWD